MRSALKKVELPQSPVVVFVLFRLLPGHKWWAFKQMGIAKQYLRKQPGLQFGEMLGTGKGRGFRIEPHFGRYAFFTSWSSEKAANGFLRHSSLYEAARARSKEIYTLTMRPVLVKGLWQGTNPFLPLAKPEPDYKGPLVALTRARIRPQKLIPFWRHVPEVSRETLKAEGLLAQTGVGELPLIQQGTVSIWENEASLKAFAYGMPAHKEVVQKTRSRHWYSEELFARFIPTAAEGSWDGQNPLHEYLPLSQNPFQEDFP